ncbi:MAG: hypothetical protein JST92_14440, partial [Deltaproteobacteria bacterium]|nr:hypothetical protein [Deltaproteobacteria bacterium]
MNATKDLDKAWDATPVESYGKIGIRVVVFHKKKANSEAQQAEPLPVSDDAGDDEPIIVGKTPIDSYLEKPSGVQCVVFLVAGQRHDALDNTFLARELNFKYLRSRTMVVVDLDRLEMEAIGEIVQGSRQGLYRGPVYHAILDRLFATLKNDPDMVQLQEEAEQEISELESGDEAVRKKLDQLIDSHHTAAPHGAKGEIEPGKDPAKEAAAFGKDRPQHVMVKATPDKGEPGQEPLLVSESPPTIRLEPETERTLWARAQPEASWADLELLEARASPPVPELSLGVTMGEKAASVSIRFNATDDTDDDSYPLETTLTLFARFKGHSEPRVLLRELRVAPKKPAKPKKSVVLTSAPSLLHIATRQPVRIVEGSASTHVRVRWDGLDELVTALNPPWSFHAHCTTLGSFPPITFSAPKEGSFEMLLDPPHGLIPGAQLEFQLTAKGPNGAVLQKTFNAEIVAAPPKLEARKIAADAPETIAQRRPPYELKYVREKEWPGNCWGETAFTDDDVGCFNEPTETKPLVLILNVDTAMLKDFRDSMLKRKLEEATIQQRLANYNSH